MRTGLFDRAWLALEAGHVQPLLVINKCDRLQPEAASTVEAQTQAYRDAGLAVHLLSVLTGQGLPALHEAVQGRRVVLLGPSGVGKSSLLSALDGGSERAIQAVRETDDKGRHTTTTSEWVQLQDGTEVIDTPGVRSFGALQVPPEVVHRAFPDVVDLAVRCRFRNCQHQEEPDCAVRTAVEDGALDRLRWQRYRRLIAEQQGEDDCALE